MGPRIVRPARIGRPSPARSAQLVAGHLRVAPDEDPPVPQHGVVPALALDGLEAEALRHTLPVEVREDHLAVLAQDQQPVVGEVLRQMLARRLRQETVRTKIGRRTTEGLAPDFVDQLRELGYIE